MQDLTSMSAMSGQFALLSRPVPYLNIGLDLYSARAYSNRHC